jgi:hypothetical protein
MFTNQLIRNRHEPLLAKTHQRLNEMIDPVLSKLFADFIGHTDHLEFAAKYYNQVRYMFHAQITLNNMNYQYLHDFLYEAKEVIQQAVELAEKNDKSM